MIHSMDCRNFKTMEEMNEYMIAKWNQKVRHNDEVVILGDFSWGNAQETNSLLERLKGRLYLIQGNHDTFLKKKHVNLNRFTWVKPYDELSDQKRKIIVCHYPIMCYNGQYRLDEAGNPKTYMLYGHVHDTKDQLPGRRAYPKIPGNHPADAYCGCAGECPQHPLPDDQLLLYVFRLRTADTGRMDRL